MTMDGVDMADAAWPRVGAEVSARGSNSERLAATAAVLLLGVVKLEPFVQPFAHEIELRAIDVRQALRIHQHLDAVLFEHMILGSDVVGVLQLVSQTRTTGGLDAQAHTDAFAALGDVARYVACGSF